MNLSHIEAVLADLTAEEVITMCGFATIGSSEDLVVALADYIEDKQETISENLEVNGVI